jgi:hypothetical protein
MWLIASQRNCHHMPDKRKVGKPQKKEEKEETIYHLIALFSKLHRASSISSALARNLNYLD